VAASQALFSLGSGELAQWGLRGQALRPMTPPPFRAEHVGSLLRPEALRRAHRDHAAGRIDDASFCAAQDASVRDAVALQESLGFKAVTDGEFRRASYWSHFVGAVDGLGVGPARFAFHDDAGAETPFLAPRVEGPVRRTGPISGAEFDFLKGTARAMPKITLPAPPTMHFWSPPDCVRAAGYPDDDAFFADLAEAYRAELADLARRGCVYVQLDEVPLVMLCDPAIRARLAAEGADPDRLIGDYIALCNASLADRPAGMTIAMHICRGNFRGRHLSAGGYGAIAERLFREVAVDAFFLEYDTPRAGDFAPLAAVPDGRTVVLGLVGTKTPALERAAALKARIAEAARFVALDRLGLSPQCGFASAVSGNPVAESDQTAKLRLVTDTARDVWADA
jgi:methionine synthase II (cobalamin-independent)